MSDIKKRSRKSKLEVRDDDIEETENAVLHLQLSESDEEELLITFPEPERPGSNHGTPSPAPQIPSTPQIPSSPQILSSPPHIPSSPPPNFDHTYALPNQVHAPSPSATSAFATTSLSSSSTYPTTTLPIPSSSALRLSVKVEVEEIDESIFNEILPQILDKPKQKVKYHSSKIKTPVTIFQVDIDKIYKAADEIGLNATNLADKILSIELKNIWGRALKPKKENDPYEESIQKALRKWSDCGLDSTRETLGPLFYQCHICEIAWWYLTPFRDHIRTEHDKNIKIQYEENGHESYIYAYEKASKNFVYIECKGNCYRCEQPYTFHMKQPGTMYSCKRCNNSFETCVSMRQHILKCLPSTMTDRLKYECTICSSKFYTNDELHSHNITVHDVRSDIVTPFICKTCSTCRRKYHHFPTHMCVRSMLMSPCSFCYQRFHTKILQAIHHFMQYGNYKCPICGKILPARCMEAEHLLTHSENYVMAYKCINYDCPPTILYPNLDMMKLHKKRYHKQKVDNRKTFYDTVLIPVPYINSAQKPTVDAIAKAYNTEVYIPEKPASKEPEVEDWCVSNVTDKQRDKQTYTPALEDDVIIVKQEPQEPIEIDDRPSQMDYAEMLSKVFKVSDAVAIDEIETQIKIEPADENEVNVQEAQISFKQEPPDAYLDRSVIAKNVNCQNINKNDKLQNHGRKRSFQENSLYASQNFNREDEIQFNFCHTDSGVKIKTEPEDHIDVVSSDSDVVPVNPDAKDIKQEIIGGTEINKNNVSDLYPSKVTKKKKKKKIVKKKSKPSLKKNNTEIKAKSNQLLKKNIIVRKEHLDVKVTTIQLADSVSDKKIKNTNVVSDTKTKIGKKNSDSKTKIKTLKLDENGKKIKKLYRCAQCGYEQCHKLFRLHQRSFCTYCPKRGKKRLCEKFQCTKCDTKDISLDDYLLHFTEHGYEMLVCPSCNLKFETLIELVPHFQTHVKLNYVNCVIIKDETDFSKRQHKSCQTCHAIVRPEDFFKHWESHFMLRKEDTAPVKMENNDDVTGAANRSLQPNVLLTATQQLRSFARESQCRVCQRVFGRRLEVKRHLIEHLLIDARNTKDKTRSANLRCQICLEGFPRPDSYKHHMRGHGRLPVYRCEICDKTFSDSSNFTKHKKIHNIWALICDICNKKFQVKSTLEKHMIMHMTTDPIKCKLCSAKFYAQSSYHKHYKSKHTPLTFRCVVCDLSFGSSKEKWDHEWETHHERRQDADCPVCQEQFRNYRDVRVHAREKHGKDIPYIKIRCKETKKEKIKKR